MIIHDVYLSSELERRPLVPIDGMLDHIQTTTARSSPFICLCSYLQKEAPDNTIVCLPGEYERVYSLGITNRRHLGLYAVVAFLSPYTATGFSSRQFVTNSNQGRTSATTTTPKIRTKPVCVLALKTHEKLTFIFLSSVLQKFARSYDCSLPLQKNLSARCDWSTETKGSISFFKSPMKGRDST